MKGLHVDDSPFHLDIPSYPPESTFAASSALDHSSQGAFPHFAKQELEQPKSQKPKTSKPFLFGEERNTRGLDCFGNLMCNLAEFNTWDMNHLANTVVPGRDKMKSIDDSVCRDMEQDDAEGVAEGDFQASMEAKKSAHMPGLKYCRVGIERSDYGSPLVPIMARHSGPLKDFKGIDEGKFVDDPSTMLAVSCISPPGDHSFWRFLPSNQEEHTTDNFSSDEFRMYEFKVRRCMRGRSHDWTECPFAHPGEKARRRDPRLFHYSGTACPDFRRGACRRGDMCELSHGVFECWLHPARYRTQLCKDGKSCKRRVCFFAHFSAQLRYVSPDPFSESGLALKSHSASPAMDAMSGCPDVPYMHLPFLAKNSPPVGPGLLDGGYVGDVFSDDFIPVTITDSLHDGFYPLTVLSKSFQNDRNLNCRSSHDQGLSIGDLSDYLKLNRHSNTATSDAHLLEELNHEGIHGHNYYLCNPPSDGSSFKASQPHINLRSQLAFASLTNNIDQIMSPTSTLMGHVFSPPPLSPPLSPSSSPPISSGTALSALSRKICGRPQSQGLASGMDGISLPIDGPLPSAAQFQASHMVNLVHSNSAPLFVNTLGPSPLSTNSLERKRHELERCKSMPTSQELIEDGGLETSSMEVHPAQAMMHLVSTLQQMELRRAIMEVKNTRNPYVSHSNPNTPKSKDPWDANGVATHRRVESGGQGLRGKIYGKLGREVGIDAENPDFAWVNELVK